MSPTRRQVIGGVAAFAALYAAGASQSGGDGSDDAAPMAPAGGAETGDTDMALYEDPEMAIADTHSDMDDFSPSGDVGFVFVWDEQLTYKVTP